LSTTACAKQQQVIESNTPDNTTAYLTQQLNQITASSAQQLIQRSSLLSKTA
jgi:hypothetical protein